MTSHQTQSVGVFELAVFLIELVLLAVLAVAGARLGGGVPALVLAFALPLAAAVMWGLLLAPRSARRLSHPGRLIVKLALMLTASSLLAISGALAGAVAFVIVSWPLIAIGELRENSRG